MASTIDQIDSYLKKNKKTLFSKLNEWYGRNKPIYEGKDFQKAFDDAKNLKYLWNSAQEAKGINSKIEAFNKLTAELDKWTDLEKLDDWEKQLEAQGLENWQVPEDRIEMDKMRLFGQLSNRPEIDETTDLSIDGVFPQNYNYNQMKVLASQYGYDYTNKEDRKEFLDKLAKYQQEKDLEDIWNSDIYTSLVTPLAKEYAKNNWQNIDSDDYIGTQGLKLPLVGNVGFGIPTNAKLFGAVAADAGVNTLMAGVPGGAAGKYLKFTPKGQMIVNNTVAPAARAGLKMAINDESFEDAGKDALNEAATNFAFRFGMRGAQRYGKELFPTGGKQTVQGRANEMANAARDRSNVHFRKPIPKVNKKGKIIGEEGFEYWVYDKNGIPQRSTYKAWINDPNRMTNKAGETAELENQTNALLTTKRFPLSENANKNIVKNLEKAGTEPEQMVYDEVAAMGVPRESFWNFAKNNPVSRDVGNYINNLQGRSKWGGAALGAVANYDPTQTISQKTFEKQPKLSQKDLAELEFLKRMAELNKKPGFDKFIEKPKLPEKFKKYKDDPRIIEIFGVQEED